MTAALLGAVAPCCCFRTRPVQYVSSPSSVSSSKNQGFYPDGSSSELSLRLFSPWRGLTPVRHSFPSNCKKIGKKRKSRCMVVYASLFGVGAPEVLVIGVVALLVFGPKGLAEVARNLGKTLRAFQPTIRELQEVSREFKSTLEREIGLDEVTSLSNSVYRPNSIFNENQHTTSDPILEAAWQSVGLQSWRSIILDKVMIRGPLQEYVHQFRHGEYLLYNLVWGVNSSRGSLAIRGFAKLAVYFFGQGDDPWTSTRDGKPTAKAPLAATDSSEEQPPAQVTSEGVTSPSTSQEASTTASPEIKAQTPSKENEGEDSK